jgi:hypothetical protein
LIILGVILLIIGFVAKIAILWTIGIISRGRRDLRVARDGRSRGWRTRTLLLAVRREVILPLKQEGAPLAGVDLSTANASGQVAVTLRGEPDTADAASVVAALRTGSGAGALAAAQ